MVSIYSTNILDIDECETTNNCHTNSHCSNNPGSYECTCKEGYSGNGTLCAGIKL